VLKKVLACAALLAGFSWAMAAPASAEQEPAVKAEVATEVGVKVRVFDMSDASDRCTLLSFILGLPVDVKADLDADAEV
jgi:hypothetical protein